jgi:hypothetical protein
MLNDILNLGLEFSLLDSAPDASQFQGVVLYDNDFSKLVFRFLLNFLMIFIIARALYYPATKRKDYLFSFILTSIVIFFICFALKKFEIKTGMALGLFAIFGIIRFRTTTMPVKEMTYLFVIVGLSVINALTSSKFSYAELAFVNFVVILAILAVEKVSLIKHESQKLVIYEKIDLIAPERHEELMADLNQRTGLKISRIEIGKINFLNDTAQISVFFYQHEQAALSFHKDERSEPGY